MSVSPIFYTLPGCEQFAPTVSHPGEDAGADIRLFVENCDFEELDSSLHNLVGRCYLRCGLFIDGERVQENQEDGKLLSHPEIYSFCKERVHERGGAIILCPGEKILVNSGFKVILPSTKNMTFPFSSMVSVYKIVPRSGLCHKHGICVSNSPGIIDSGYQDWVKVSLFNEGSGYHIFTHGSRIAQGICEFVVDQSNRQVTTNENVFSVTGRHTGGFGSTRVSV